MSGDAALMCHGVVLVIILTAAYLLGVALGRALRARWDSRRTASERRFPAQQRSEGRTLPPGPLWQNNRLYETRYLRWRAPPRGDYRAAGNLPEGVRNERSSRDVPSSVEDEFW